MHSLFGVAPGAFSRNYEDFLALLHDEDRERIRDEFDRAARHAPPWTLSSE
jgi:hypothetical protein